MCPSLFLLDINDLPNYVSSQIAIYADDSTLYTAYPGPLSALPCAQASIVLNQDLDNVINWGNDWLVTFNQKKTHLLSMSRSRSPYLSMNYIPLQELTDIRLSHVTSPGTRHLWYIAKRASQCLARQYVPPTDILYLYKSTIRPVMENCCGVAISGLVPGLSSIPAQRNSATCC